MKTTIRLGALIVMAISLVACATPKQTSVAVTAPVEVNIAIPSGGLMIPATLTIPAIESGKTVPAVVMMHGTGSSRDEAGNGYKMLAPELAKAGIASIRFDFPGSGESTASYRLYTNSEAVREASAVADYLRSLPFIDGKRIGVMGWSQGGTDALLAAARDNRFASVLTWAGALEIGDMATEEMRKEAKEKGYTLMTFDWRDPLELSEQWIEEADSDDVLAEVKAIKAPIMMLHGDQDTTVPPTDGQKVKEASSNPNSQWVLIPGADHTFLIFTGDLTAFHLLEEKTVDWFTKTL